MHSELPACGQRPGCLVADMPDRNEARRRGLRSLIVLFLLGLATVGPAAGDGGLFVFVTGGPPGQTDIVLRFRHLQGDVERNFDLIPGQWSLVDVCGTCYVLGGTFYLLKSADNDRYRLVSGSLTEVTDDDNDTTHYQSKNLIIQQEDTVFPNFASSDYVELDDEHYEVNMHYQERAKYTVSYKFNGPGSLADYSDPQTDWIPVGDVIVVSAPSFPGYTCIGHTGSGTFATPSDACSVALPLQSDRFVVNELIWRYRAQADVELRSIAAAGLVASGRPVTVETRVVNHGPYPTRDADVVTSTAPGASFGDATGCDSTSVVAGEHRCRLVGLAVGEEATLTLEIVAPPSDDSMTTTARVETHDASDVVASNNSRSVTTTVDGIDPALAITAPRSSLSLGTVGDFIDLRGTANDASGVDEICWQESCRSVRATGVDGEDGVDWFFRRLPVAAGQTRPYALRTTDGADREASTTVTVASKAEDEILASLSFAGQAVDLEAGAVLANPVVATVDPVLDVDEVQLFLNGEQVATAAGSVLTAHVDLGRYPDGDALLEVAVRLVGGRVVRDTRRIPVTLAAGVLPTTPADVLWSVRPALTDLGTAAFRDLSADGRWAVVATDLRTAVQASDEIVGGALHHQKQEVASATSSLRRFDGDAWVVVAPHDLVDPQGLLCASTPELPCLVFTAVEVDASAPGDGVVWIGTHRGLIQASDTVPPIVEAVFDADDAAGPAGSWITDLHLAANGDLWVAHRASRWYTLQANAERRYWRHFGGVSRKRGTHWTQFRAQHDADGSTDAAGAWMTVAGLRPTRVATTAGGSVWVASEAGLSIFQDGVWRHENATTGLPFDDVRALAVAEVAVGVDPPPAQPGAFDPPPFTQDQVWAWVGGHDGAAFLRRVPPAAGDGTPQPGTPTTSGTWTHFTRDNSPLPSDDVRDLAICCTGGDRPLVWLATGGGVVSLDPAGLTWLRHDEPGDGRAGALAGTGGPTVSTAVTLDDPAGGGRVASVDLSLAMRLTSPADGARIATGESGTAEVVLAWEPVPDATSYEVFVNGEQVGRTSATSRTLRLPAGDVWWSVRALYDGDRRALARALPRRLHVQDGTGPIEFLTLAGQQIRHVQAAADGTLEASFEFAPFPTAGTFTDLAAEATGSLVVVDGDGFLGVHPVPIGRSVDAGDWRVDDTAEPGGLVLGDVATGRIHLYESSLATLTYEAATAGGLRDVAGLDGGRFAALTGGGTTVHLFERDGPRQDLVAAGSVALGEAATALAAMPGGGFAVLSVDEVWVYDVDAMAGGPAGGYRLGARFPLPSLGTARDLACDERGRLFVLFDGAPDVVVFSHDLGRRDAGVPAPTALAWRQVAVGDGSTAIATFASPAGRAPLPPRDYDPPTDPPAEAGPNSGEGGIL